MTLAATSDVFDHDPQSATTTLAPLQPVDDTAFLKLNADGAFYGLPNYWLAAGRGDWAAALADARLCDAWLGAHEGADKVFSLMQAVWIRPLAALRGPERRHRRRPEPDRDDPPRLLSLRTGPRDDCR